MSSQGRSLVELTTRTIQGRYLLCPSGTLNLITTGILARAQKLTGAEVHGAFFLSTHGQILASFDSVQQMATFMAYVNGKLGSGGQPSPRLERSGLERAAIVRSRSATKKKRRSQGSSTTSARAV